jgi:hypothetical protein
MSTLTETVLSEGIETLLSEADSVFNRFSLDNIKVLYTSSDGTLYPAARAVIEKITSLRSAFNDVREELLNNPKSKSLAGSILLNARYQCRSLKQNGYTIKDLDVIDVSRELEDIIADLQVVI